MERTGKSNNSVPAGRGPCDLHRILDGFSACRKKDRLGRTFERRQRCKPLGKRDVGLVWRHLKSGVGKTFELRGHRAHDSGMTVTCIQDRDAAGEVDVSPSLNIP